MRRGCALVLDEIDQHSAQSSRFALHAILDDRSIAGITLPTGERVEPAEGFHGHRDNQRGTGNAA